MIGDAQARRPTMTLRSRLVLAVVTLVAAGLAVFGVATYTLYARSEYQRLDERIRASIPLVTGQLYRNAGLDEGAGQPGGNGPGSGSNGGAGSHPAPPILVPPGTYAELRDSAGTFITSVQYSNSTSQPDLPAELDVPAHRARLFTTGSVEGSGQWRASVSSSGHDDGNAVVVAVPRREIATALDRLVVIEVVTSAVLLALLAAGSWMILRRGLRPLEHMAASARSITAGDLSQRVAPSEERTEVGQLGLALNTMLGEIEEAFREREATEQRLRQLLADVSHELRTPLTSIQGFAELFRLESARGRVDQAVVLRRIEEETARMRTLVDDLLLLARLDETRPVEWNPVDLSVLAADACSDAAAAEPGRSITLDAPDPVVIAGDRDHLRQALANLMTNALRHTPPGTPIEVSARRLGDEATLVVRDHGPGLDEAALQYAFDRFWQADQARVGPGAGLGLSIVTAIANEHGGHVTAANADDGGAVFTIALPVSTLLTPELIGAPSDS
jgi:two-component system, OmpR family, sensor kinase